MDQPDDGPSAPVGLRVRTVAPGDPSDGSTAIVPLVRERGSVIVGGTVPGCTYSTLALPRRGTRIKLVVEAIDLAAYWLREIRNEVGSGLNLAIDFHHRLNVAESALFCQRVEDLHLYFVEEPLRSENPRAYQQLRTMTSVPFAVS